MGRPQISIVIPTYREEKFIGDTLKQFLSHKARFRLEIIVADGGSKDGTVEIARRYADKVLIEKRRKNIASGRNLGCFAAEGDIIFCTDADIRIPDPVRFFKRLRQEFGDRQTVGITGPLRIYTDEESLVDRLWHALINCGVRFSMLIGKQIAKGEFNIMRRDAFRSIGG